MPTRPSLPAHGRTAAPAPLLCLLWPALLAQRLALRGLGTSGIHVDLLHCDHPQVRPVGGFGLAKTATLITIITTARAKLGNALGNGNGAVRCAPRPEAGP